MADVPPCALVCVYTRNLKTADVNKTEQLADREGEKQESLVRMCVRPPAGHRHVISHLEGYPIAGLKLTSSTCFQKYSNT